MNPEAIPWLLCGTFCILPLMIGTGSFFAWCLVLNRFPSREVSTFLDEEGKKHVHTEWTWLTRYENYLRSQSEEKE